MSALSVISGFKYLQISDRRALTQSTPNQEQALSEKVAKILKGVPKGSTAIMLREKDLPGRTLFELACELLEITRNAEAPLIINDRVDIAVAVGASGVHLPSRGIPTGVARDILGNDRIIGVSTHTIEGAIQAAFDGADYITFGPVFDTPSKRPLGSPVGLHALKEATEELSRQGRQTRVFGLGGITCAQKASEVFATGAKGVAFIRAVLCSEDPSAAMAAFLRAGGDL